MQITLIIGLIFSIAQWNTILAVTTRLPPRNFGTASTREAAGKIILDVDPAAVVLPGTVVKLSCDFRSGDPYVSLFTWFHNEQEILSKGGIAGKTHEFPVSENTTGNYTCSAQSDLGFTQQSDVVDIQIARVETFICPYSNQIQTNCGKVCTCDNADSCGKVCVSEKLENLPCFCKPGYFKNAVTGTCELDSQHTSTPKSVDATKSCLSAFQEQRSGCHKKCRCSDLQAGNRRCATLCSGGPTACTCIDGYFFDTEFDHCRPLLDCFPSTPNATTNTTSSEPCYQQCGCSEALKGVECPAVCDWTTRPGGCREDYFYDTETSICRPISECHADQCSSFNETRTSTCYLTCSCKELEGGSCTEVCYGADDLVGTVPPCVCKPGYFLDYLTGKCVNLHDCNIAHPTETDIKNTSIKACPLEHQSNTNSHCQEACTCLDVQDNICRKMCVKFVPTANEPGPCLCIGGYFYDTDEKRCRLKEECQATDEQKPIKPPTSFATEPCFLPDLPSPPFGCQYDIDHDERGCPIRWELICPSETTPIPECPTVPPPPPAPVGCYYEQERGVGKCSVAWKLVCQSQDRTCQINETLVACYACDRTCQERDLLPSCPEICNVAGACACNDGYVRDSAGGCIRPVDCPEPQCNLEREEFKECGTSCEETCDGIPELCSLQCISGCFCKTGFVKDSNTGKCISKSGCGNNTPFVCSGQNVEFTTCGSSCSESCTSALEGVAKPCTAKCQVGCYCKAGYYRNPDGDCISKSQCATPKEPQCGDNEQFSECGPSCNEAACNTKDAASEVCTLNCKRGCFCNEKYVRLHKDGKCVKPSECPTVTPTTTSICMRQPEAGHCKANIQRFYYNPKTRHCESFRYGGCGSNGNNFKSFTTCMESCFVKHSLDANGQCPDGRQPANTLVDPCSISVCSVNDTVCITDYCAQDMARFFKTANGQEMNRYQCSDKCNDKECTLCSICEEHDGVGICVPDINNARCTAAPSQIAYVHDDPCSANNCQPDQFCVAVTVVCKKLPCPQYFCQSIDVCTKEPLQNCDAIDCPVNTPVCVEENGDIQCRSLGQLGPSCSVTKCQTGYKCTETPKKEGLCGIGNNSDETMIVEPEGNCSLIRCASGTSCVENSDGTPYCLPPVCTEDTCGKCKKCVPSGKECVKLPCLRYTCEDIPNCHNATVIEANSVCDNNEEFNECGTACEDTCDSVQTQRKIPCPRICVRACFCKEGYIRLVKDGNCVSINTCKANESPNPCSGIKCGGYQRCVPEPKQCVTTPCPQYRCEDIANRPSRPGQCGINQSFTTCGTACPKTCANINTNRLTPCTLQCVRGCACDKGFVKNVNGQCIKPEHCPGSAGNCSSVNCASGTSCVENSDGTVHCLPPVCTEDTCGNCKKCVPNGQECIKLPCLRYTCEDIPNCQNSTVVDAVPLCGKNEEFNECGTACEKTCSSVQVQRNIPCPRICVRACFCTDGYVRLAKDGNCVPIHACTANESPNPCSGIKCAACQRCVPEPKQCFTTPCPQYRCEDIANCPSRPGQCGINESFTTCGTACPKTCANVNTNRLIPCTQQCVRGCACDKGFVKNVNGQCIKPEHCPVNESPDSCFEIKCAECQRCVPEPKQCFTTPCPQYRCEDIANCPSRPGQCGINQSFTTCGTACPKTCANVNINRYIPCTRQCVRGCACDKGFVKNVNGQCVRPENCPGNTTIQSDVPTLSPCASVKCSTGTRCIEDDFGGVTCIGNAKPGSCPRVVQNTSGSQGIVCPNTCISDADCVRNRKCCPNSCGKYQCLSPV